MTTLRELLHDYPFLDELPEEWLDQLADIGHRVSFQTGHRIFAENGRAENFWFITDGAIGLDMNIPGKGHVPIDTLQPGSVLGWSWLFPPYRWHFGAVAQRTVHAVQFHGADVTRLCDEDSAFGHELMRRFVGVVVERLQATRVRLNDLYQ